MMGLLANRRWVLYWIVLMLFILGMLQSCSLEKKLNRAKLVMSEHPNEFAQLASSLYPSKETYIKGRDSIVRDTVYEEKTVRVPVVVKGDTVFVDVPCPKERVVTKMVTRVDTVRGEDGRKLAAVQVEKSKMNNDIIKERTLREGAENGSKSKNWWIGGLGLLLLASIYFHLRKIF